MLKSCARTLNCPAKSSKILPSKLVQSGRQYTSQEYGCAARGVRISSRVVTRYQNNEFIDWIKLLLVEIDIILKYERKAIKIYCFRETSKIVLNCRRKKYTYKVVGGSDNPMMVKRQALIGLTVYWSRDASVVANARSLFANEILESTGGPLSSSYN